MERALDIAGELLRQPTAPFFEDLPTGYVLAFTERHDGLTASTDAAGNVVVRTEGDGHPLVLVAHLDHPGFSVEAVGAHVSLEFRGGLALDAARPGAEVELFRRGEAEPIGRAMLTGVGGDLGRLTTARATVTEGVAVVGGYAMWAFPGFTLVHDRIVGRVCDDLVGAAAVLAALERLAGARPARSVWGLFTRAEEVGFLGAMEAIRLATVPPVATVLSLECSKARPDAPQGGGVIVRVGDRMSIFDPGVTEWLRVAADAAGVRHQRKLMDGGACEATAFCAAGFRASGLAVPLGNYHNAADDGSGVAPEHVKVDDYLAEVELLVALGSTDVAPLAAPAWFDRRAAEAREAFGA